MRTVDGAWERDELEAVDGLSEALLRRAAAEYAQALTEHLPAPEACRYQPSPRLARRMRRLLGRVERQEWWRTRPPRLRAALIAAALTAVLAAGFTVGAGQKASYALFYAVEEDGIRYAVRADWDAERERETICLGYVPEGYELIDTRTKVRPTYEQIRLSYSDSVGGAFQVTETFANQMTGNFLSGTVEEISVGGLDCLLMESADQTKRNLVWTVEGNILTLSGNLEREELIRIAEQIQIDHTNGL